MAFFENLENTLMQREQQKFMRAALREAEKAYRVDEVPIGCVIVRDGHIIARGYNRRNTDKRVTRHAELIAIEAACKKCGDWRLEDCELYVTLEPCPMCAGAIVQARIPKVHFGAKNAKAGCAGSVIDLLRHPGFNHQAEVYGGVLEEECSAMMSGFFEELRAGRKTEETSGTAEAEPLPEGECFAVSDRMTEEG